MLDALRPYDHRRSTSERSLNCVYDWKIPDVCEDRRIRTSSVGYFFMHLGNIIRLKKFIHLSQFQQLI